MRMKLSDGRYAYDCGNRGLLITSKPHAKAAGVAIVCGVAAALFIAAAFCFGCCAGRHCKKKRR